MKNIHRNIVLVTVCLLHSAISSACACLRSALEPRPLQEKCEMVKCGIALAKTCAVCQEKPRRSSQGSWLAKKRGFGGGAIIADL